MDYRSNKILNYLLEGKQIRISELSKEFQLSERMIKKIIKELNEDLNQNEIPEIQYDSKGVIKSYLISDELYEKIRYFILENDYYTYHLTASERKTITAMILLNHEGYITAAMLSEYLQISRNTMLSDINELKGWFADNGLRLCSQVQKGYIIEGDELSIRNGIMKLVQLNCEFGVYKDGNIIETFHHLLLRELQYEQRMPIIQKIVREEEKKQDLYFSDFSFMEVSIELLIILNRIMLGKSLPKDIVGDDIKNSSKYMFSCAIMNRLGEQFQIEIPEVEKKHYVRNLRRISYIKSSTQNVEEIVIPVMIGEVIHHICHQFNISFYLDFALYDVLVDHMKSIIYRSRVGEFLPNPFGNEMQERYPEIFAAVKQSVEPLERHIGFSFKKDEISFLVMYFAAMIEKERQERIRDQRVSVILVGNMGRGVMNYIRTELEKLDDIIQVEKTCSAHEIDNIPDDQIDMIISYVPLANRKYEVPIVQINGLILSKDDVYKIRMMAMDILGGRSYGQMDENAEKQKFYEEMLLEYTESSLIFPNTILLDADAHDWQEAIQISGELLYESGSVTKEYIEAMIENVKINGTYIVIYPGLAIPHAEKEKGALREAISFVRLKCPVVFGSEKNDPVSYVIGMSILNSDSINQVIFNLIQMFSNEGFKEQMDTAASTEEMYQLIKDKI